MVIIVAAFLALLPNHRLVHAQASTARPVSNLADQMLAELEAAETRANEDFSLSVPPELSLLEARAKGYKARQAADITYDEESEAFLRDSIAWFRWAALQGDGSAAEELAHRYRELARQYTEKSETWWPHFKLDERLGKAYRALSCKWYRRAADTGNQAALGYVNWGACRGE